MVGIRQWLRRSDANSNVRPATGVPDHRCDSPGVVVDFLQNDTTGYRL